MHKRTMAYRPSRSERLWVYFDKPSPQTDRKIDQEDGKLQLVIFPSEHKRASTATMM